jgi:hypothetical protein
MSAPRRDRATVEQLYESVRSQVENQELSSFVKVELVHFQWRMVLALLTQELGVQYMVDSGLRPMERSNP